MDHKFTEQVGLWLNSHKDEREYKDVALMLLRLSGNQIMYLNNIRCIESRKDFIAYQLQKHYNFRVQSLTHAQVEEMAAQVVSIAEECSRHGIHRTTTYNNLAVVKALLPMLCTASRDFHRWRNGGIFILKIIKLLLNLHYRSKERT